MLVRTEQQNSSNQQLNTNTKHVEYQLGMKHSNVSMFECLVDLLIDYAA
jgi:hypothetical protein